MLKRVHASVRAIPLHGSACPFHAGVSVRYIATYLPLSSLMRTVTCCHVHTSGQAQGKASTFACLSSSHPSVLILLLHSNLIHCRPVPPTPITPHSLQVRIW